MVSAQEDFDGKVNVFLGTSNNHPLDRNRITQPERVKGDVSTLQTTARPNKNLVSKINLSPHQLMKAIKNLILLTGLLISVKAAAQDWPNLKHYRAANEKLRDSTVTTVYMGDSITDFWVGDDPTFFKDNHYADRGISGQTSPQMLLRFRQDVIDLHPKAVVILCGTNDVAGNTGPMTPEMTEDNIQSMAELAKAHKIKVILCSVLPADHFGWKPALQPADSIIALNQWIKAYAKQNHFGYVDYYSAMVNDQKGMKSDYSKDGVHPNLTGYQVMEPLVQAAIKKAL